MLVYSLYKIIRVILGGSIFRGFIPYLELCDFLWRGLFFSGFIPYLKLCELFVRGFSPWGFIPYLNIREFFCEGSICLRVYSLSLCRVFSWSKIM